MTNIPHSSQKSFGSLALLQSRLASLLLITFSLLCAPLSLAFTLYFYLSANGIHTSGKIIRISLDRLRLQHEDRSLQDTSDRQTVLITGSRGVKALALARAFQRSNPHHRVILADSKSWSIVSPARFSSSVTRHYFLPSSSKQPKEYKRFIVNLIQSERVTYWIPCSGPSNTILDSEIGEEIQNELGTVNCFCWVPTKKLTETLHEKDKFMALCVELNMVVPDCSSHLSSVEEAMIFLYNQDSRHTWSYILKPIEFVNGAERTDFTMLPLGTREETEKHLISKFHSFRSSRSGATECQTKPLFILQRFIKGSEYCTHASVHDNMINSFVCCKGSDMVMRYEDVRRLASHHKVSVAAEEWSKDFLAKLKAAHSRFDGHLSIDFIYEEVEGILYPIECNPRVHTAVILFRSVAEALAESYLSKTASKDIVRPSLHEPAHIWIQHSLPLSILNTIPSVFRPLLKFLHPNLTKDYFQSFYENRFDPIAFSPKPEETPLWLIRSVLWKSSVHPNAKILTVNGDSHPISNEKILAGLSNMGATQIDTLWDLEYHSDDLLIWWVMSHVYWNWLLFYQVFIRNEPWSRVNVSTGRIWEL